VLEELWMPKKPSTEIVGELVDLVFKYSPSKLKIRAICLQLYSLAIHNQFYQARDLMMKSRLAVIPKQKIQVQVSFNRALV
jgi:translation initiation factor 3 subunit C